MKNNTLRPPEYINKITPYIPGKPIEELERELGISNCIKLASNENPLGPSPLAIKEMQAALVGLNRYPDGGAYRLKTALSGFYGVDAQDIVIGHGSNELLDVAVRTFMPATQDNIYECIMADPSFIVYYNSTVKAAGKAVKVPLTHDYRHDLPAMSARINDKTRIVFIANPNNPTGTIVRAEEFDSFMRDIPDNVLVVVDEAYYEYVSDKAYPDSMRYFKEGYPILILRTFSKIYGLAGLRIGYGIANRTIVGEMDKVREPFNTGSVSQMAAIGALKDTEHVSKSVAVNEAGKAYLYEGLRQTPVEFVQTQGNFIYINLRVDANNIYNKLLQRGVIVRPMGKTIIRVTIGLQNENETFMRNLREVL
ncbi:histidinol-phosphate aminotransferase [Candidatus Magnetobacterium bavaricum]|uniref:Histidinol-phosphate aminotransferase n=1 Tax=Candidatus Magnetobacterium bavaricum TaxID=29290 RepID=A0A0F3GME2_9BACT|nr:histidinol-phosphate aminotransferase [Candidatus Magnetobacterium bavaricum]